MTAIFEGVGHPATCVSRVESVVLKDPAVGEPAGKWLRDLAATTKSVGSVVDQLAAT